MTELSLAHALGEEVRLNLAPHFVIARASTSTIHVIRTAVSICESAKCGGKARKTGES